MAGSKIKAKVCAASLIETLIAMVIIMIIFAIAMDIFGRVMRFSLSAKKLHARAILQGQLFQPDSASTEEALELIDSIRIVREIKPLTADPGLQQLTLRAYDENNFIIDSLSKVVTTDHEAPTN